MTARIALGLGLLSCAGLALAWGDSCEFSADRALVIDARGLAELDLLARAGDLEIRGDSKASTISVSGRACASSEALLAGIQLSETRQGDTLSVGVLMPEVGSGWGSSAASLDLVVSLPLRMRLRLEDSSGDLSVEGVAAVTIDDSSGDITLRNIAGQVQIEDNSGDIDAREIDGDVTVSRDNSGDIRIENVQGQARVLRDSSGAIRIADVRGDAYVGEDGSGEIVFLRIGGSAEVGEDGSGGIRAEQVSGDFSVRADGSGGIEHRDIGGRVSIPAD